MKLIFKYKYKEYNFSKKYIKICDSFRLPSDVSIKLSSERYLNILKKDNILDEVYLSNYLYDTDLNLAEYILDKLNDKKIDDYDIGSQGWDVELEKDKVIISQMCSSENDKKVYINREEVAYAMLKWKSFLEREFDDPNYHEIIDTEDIYK